MSVRSVVTRGYGAGGSAALVVTRGYAPGAAVEEAATVYGSGNDDTGRTRGTRRFWTHGTHAEVAAIRAEVEARVQAQHGPVPAPAAAVINRLALEQADTDGDEVLQLSELLHELDRAGVPFEDHYGGRLAALRREYESMRDTRLAQETRLRAEHAERVQAQADAEERARLALKRRQRAMTALLLSI